MSKYTKVEKDIWMLKDGSLWEGNINECPEGNPDNVAKAGKEYSEEYLKGKGWGKKKAAPKKKAAATKAPETKAQKPAEDK
tara:strand:- start:259 stop:501 length:243 start_codon:yes stop_codon:yes gene_type:complete